ncbi:predicted protein [Lichtheimia corymbifera JMRC:FSU:9682]|uniref:Uncharacterized protein n=1 Tax=Lichtheimia corymbifera JMRC:FSU:9682 TaxID=1263082 RepID=A0A068S081_9FUNG|nr:predicted protein [Lichtheimia corymbifera JMRC:FSU:9682]
MVIRWASSSVPSVDISLVGCDTVSRSDLGKSRIDDDLAPYLALFSTPPPQHTFPYGSTGFNRYIATTRTYTRVGAGK